MESARVEPGAQDTTRPVIEALSDSGRAEKAGGGVAGGEAMVDHVGV